MRSRHSPKNEDERDEDLGSLLMCAADRLALKVEPDFAAVYSRHGEQVTHGDLSRRRRHVLPLAAAAAAALAFGFILQQGSVSGYRREGLLYSHEISQLAHGLVGFHPQPLFSGAASVAGPIAGSETAPTSPSGELTNFIDDLWNREGS